MNYEVVTLEAIQAAGLSVRTGNNQPDMMEKIGGLWQKYMTEAEKIIPNQNGRLFGVYTNYDSDVNGMYDMVVCCGVDSYEGLEDKFVRVEIPSGKYAKFTFHGDPCKDTGAFWMEVWKTPLNRKYTADFEEYLTSNDPHDVPINIYIALAE